MYTLRSNPISRRYSGRAFWSCDVYKTLVVLIGCVAVAAVPARATAEPPREHDYLQVVRSYADVMIAQGRDVYGEKHSPLFAEALDRRSVRMSEGDSLRKVAGITRDDWGVRPHDRMIAGGNPQHCQNLYQILYALAEVTGEKRYAHEADSSLAYCFEHCQSSATGLLYWGEHAGWDFHTEKRIEKPAGNVHEFYRPWVLWERSWQLAPEACHRFALGLWEHQIGDHQKGDFSRHAPIDSRGPGTNAPYARHGGFFIETWATAYDKTKEKVFLQAIESVLDGLERARIHEGGMVIASARQGPVRRSYDLSLAISLGNSAAKVTPELAAKMHKVASANDQVFAKAHAGATTVSAAQLWSNAYGGSGMAGQADTCMLRYRQVRVDAYRRVVLETADLYRDHKVKPGKPVWPGTMGNVILLMLNAHELTNEAKYSKAAERFARKGIELYLGDGCPLPAASHVHDHYEAVTNGDTLMMALLRLWQVQNGPGADLELVFTDR